MAIYLDFSILIIDKAKISNPAPIKERLIYNTRMKYLQEDNHLIAFTVHTNYQVNGEPYYHFEDMNLEKVGLNKENSVAFARWQGFSWEVDWIESYGDYAWHIKDSGRAKQPITEILANMTVEEFFERYKSAEKFLKEINVGYYNLIQW